MRRTFNRRFRRPTSKARTPKWFTSIFDTALTFDAVTVTNLVLFDPQVVLSAAQLEVSRILTLKRIMFHGCLSVSPSGSTEASASWRGVCAAYTQDADDTDTSLIVSGPSDILVTERVIYTKGWNGIVNAAAAATVDQANVFDGVDCSFDVRTNLSVRGDQLLQYGWQSFTSTAVTARVTGIGRVLVVQP